MAAWLQVGILTVGISRSILDSSLLFDIWPNMGFNAAVRMKNTFTVKTCLRAHRSQGTMSIWRASWAPTGNVELVF